MFGYLLRFDKTLSYLNLVGSDFIHFNFLHLSCACRTMTEGESNGFPISGFGNADRAASEIEAQ